MQRAGSDRIGTKQNPRMPYQYKLLVPIDLATSLAG
jgi:hypothetical protein